VKLAAVPLASLLFAPSLMGCGGEDETHASSLEGQPWVLASGIDLPQDVAIARPSATFQNGTVAGSGGCNRYTGPYTLDGDSLELGQLATTQMACPPPADAIERAYLSALGQVGGWHSDADELVLTTTDHDELLRFAPATPVGSWQVTGLLRGDAFTSPLTGIELTARFGEDGTVEGSAGCNSYGASYTSDKGALEIDEPAATRKACADPAGVMEQESAYLALLPMTASFQSDGRSLELLAADGKRLVSYVRDAG
jgi:heat shock protein HslJ